MKIVKVSGKNNKHKVLMYAISTCAWCKMTKKFLKDGDVEYEYVDVDLCDEEDREKIRQGILDRGGSLSYPTIIIDDKILITGFRKDKLTEVLEIDNLGKSAAKS
jgi:glutaredoxin